MKPLLEELVFVGGCTAGLLVTDEGAAPVRPTHDVDAIIEVTSYSGYVDFSSRLLSLGFISDTSEGAPMCRWRYPPITLDVMPMLDSILGFSSGWYRGAWDAAVIRAIEPGTEIRVITAPWFVATKLEAFNGRGNGDYSSSHDIEDIVCIVDGGPGLYDDFAERQRIFVCGLQRKFNTISELKAFRTLLQAVFFPIEPVRRGCPKSCGASGVWPN